MVVTRNLAQYAEIHRTRRYGATSALRRPLVEPWIALSRPKSLLDYGAGQSSLALDLQVPSLQHRDRYDPAIPEIATIPRSRYDIIVCTDVLEHIDEAEIAPILADVRRLADRAIFCIHLGPAKATLPNGENAHATIRPAAWWLDRLRLVFPTATIIHKEYRLVAIYTEKPSTMDWIDPRILVSRIDWHATAIGRRIRRHLGRLRGKAEPVKPAE